MSIEVCAGAGSNRIKRLHRLPVNSKDAGIGAGANANTETYWRPLSANDVSNPTAMLASFRGRELNGDTITLPKDYKGYILNETKKPLSEDADRKFFVDGTFEELTYWNWDKKTSLNDPIRRFFEWIDIAEVLHAPIEDSSDENGDSKLND